MKIKNIEVQSFKVGVTIQNGEDYICIIDMAQAKTDASRAADIIKNWLRTKATLEFLGTWEKIYKPNFKVVKFDRFKSQAGLPSFVLSPTHWVEKNQCCVLFPLRKTSAKFSSKQQKKDLRKMAKFDY